MSTNHPEIKTDVYEIINNKICALMEQGQIPWKMCWSKGKIHLAVSHTTGKEYSFLNNLLIAADDGEWPHGEYLTFKQAIAEGGSVKPGAKGHFITFWSFPEKKEIQEDGTEKIVKSPYPILRYYYVFEVSQCTGIKRKYPNIEPEVKEGVNPIEAAEEVIKNYYSREGVKLNICVSNKAYFRPSTDEVVCPLMGQFENEAEYYSTLFHETTHSTGIETRLNRYKKGDHDPFGSESYSKEELVAEMGAAYSLGRLGIESDFTVKNSAAYLQNWLEALRNDKHLFVCACSRAEEAVKFIFDNVRPERN